MTMPEDLATNAYSEAQPCTTAGVTLAGPQGYELLDEVGRGGMGIVYRARDVALGRDVAVKLLADRYSLDSHAAQRFLNEARITGQLQHPGIPAVHQVGHLPDGRPFLAMKLIKGCTLETVLKDRPGLSAERGRLLAVFEAVCQAVGYAHAHRVIHRDLKPANVMVGAFGEVQVMDWGLAKVLDEKGAAPAEDGSAPEVTRAWTQVSPTPEAGSHTQAGSLVGTPAFVPPEQAAGELAKVDERADVFGLGALLAVILTGKPPYVGESFEAVRVLAVRGKLDDCLARLEACGAEPELVSLCRQCLAFEPADRPRDAGEVAQAVARLRSAAEERARTAERDKAAADARSEEQRRKRRWQLAAAGLVVVALAGGLVGLGAYLRAQTEANADLEAKNSELAAAQGELETTLYLQRIALADREWSANNLSRMEALLEQCPSDLRGWEWHYLKRLRYSNRTPLRHESAVISVAFNRDGQLLVTGAQAGVVTVWQAKTGQELRKWLAHRENVTSVEFSPNGRYIATGSWDRTVKVWDLEKVLQGEVRVPFVQLKQTLPVRSVTFSPDGQRLASAAGRAADEKGELKVWDLDTGQEALTLSGFTWGVYCVRFSPDGRQVATASAELVKLWDAQNGQEQLTCRDPLGNLQEVSFSPDGRRLAAVGGHIAAHPDREIKVWDAQTGQEVLNLRGHVGGLRSVAFSPDGRRLASAGLGQTVKLWDVASGQEVLTLPGHLDNVFCLAFSPDGHQLASGSTDKTVWIWDATPVEREPGPEYLTLHGHTGAVTDVAFHPTDGRHLASAGSDGTVRVWDAWSGKELYSLAGSPSGMGLRLAYSPDGRHLAAVESGAYPGSRSDRPLRVWDTATSKETRGFGGHTSGDLCLAFSPDSRHFASAGFDHTVRLWDATTGKEVQAFKHHSWPIHGVAFRPPDGRNLASGSADSTVRVWDWTTGEEPRVLEPGHAARVASVAFSRDGELLASGGGDRTVKVWDARTWKLLHDLHDPTGAVQCVAFGRDRRRLAWGSTDSTVKVWDGPGTETHVLRGHTSWVWGLAFSRDGQWIASASLDGTVKVWKAPPEPPAW
jgi:WD40 repeat protein/serine/threonine protein kinase